MNATIELVFLACSLVAGQQCKDIHIPLMPTVNSHQCMLFGQMIISNWQREGGNQNWSPKRGFSCAKVGTVANL